MKRRDFITTAAGAAGLGMTGCAGKMLAKKELPPFSFGDNYPHPESGSMPYTELGSTGIRVSKFGFGSHMRPYLRPYEKERERMLRDAHEMGVNVFDVYDTEHGVFQYEPTGRHLAPVIDDVIISIAISPYDGRNLEQELHRDMECFHRDYIDMVRIHVYSKDHRNWGYWDQLFKWKEQGLIRAVGVPIHLHSDLFPLIDEYPIDYVIFPYNFYMNTAWDGHFTDKPYDTIPGMLKKRGIGVITMKPFAGDYLAYPLSQVAERFAPKEEVNFAQAALRYVINSGVPDTTFTGMYYPSHVYENIEAYYNPTMTDAEKKLLDKVRRVAVTESMQAHLPDHYRFFSEWVPETIRDHGNIRFA